MALQFADPGGEFYFSLGLAAPGLWSALSSAVALTNAAPAGRSTLYAVQISSASGQQWIQRVVAGGNFARFIVGGAYYVPTAFTNGFIILTFFDGVNTQVDLRIDSGGHLFVTRNGTTLGSASTLTISAGQGWTYIEMDSTIDPTVGAVQVWVNGISWINLTGQNTRASANSFMNQVRYGSVLQSGANSYWKDMYGLDTVGGVNKTRLGDITVNCFFPNAAGANQGFTTLVGSSQTVAVQDGIAHTGTWPDGDTSYIADGTSGHKSDFAHQALTLTGTIFGAVHHTYAKKDDAGSKSVNQICLSGAAQETSAAIGLGNSYSYYADVIENDPNTSAAWTPSGFNAATFGVQVV